MTRNPVTSSQIRSLGYDPKTKTMEIEFHQHPISKIVGAPDKPSVYQYSDVGAEDFRKLSEAKSIGSHFHKEIKGKFGHKKMP